MGLLGMSTANGKTATATRRLFVASALLLLLSGVSWAAPTAPEYQLKAVFLFNFTQFVEWPPPAFETATSPIVIGILGSDPFGAYLDDTVKNETINGRPLSIERYTKVEDVKLCHVLFISRSETPRLQQILTGLKNKNILTVSEIENFSRLGGMIRFTTVENKVRLRINLEATKAANLTISSKLLRPAEIVASGEE